ncbi:putative secreted protein [Marinomonas sp. MED121]|uniref:DUF6931 family protein n=1 Tax=Marinomonas sp. MED121 TaxID=314277 RepID=UPI0000690418|nr:hypothetical protein [Marinomonas sp. MED121]EAQ66499.1 putative secreted protein [Marinomonas sp. MED121]
MLKKIPLTSCEKIWERFKSSDEANEIVDLSSEPSVIINSLLEAGLYQDLVHFYCHALPMRETIWWCVCSIELRQDVLTKAELSLFDVCKDWVREPQEPKRRYIEKQMQQLKNESFVRWLAQGVVWNGSGSIAEISLPVVMPAEFLYSKAIAGAINTAAVLPEWKGRDKFYKQAFASAFDIAQGGKGIIN